jgi:HlyD family secretion protein
VKPKIIIRSLLLIAVLAAGYWFFLRHAAASPALKISGNIEMTQVDIAFKVPGKLIERTVDEGQDVKKGMLIARLDPEQATRQTQRDQASVVSASTQLQQMLTAVALQKETMAADLQMKRADLRQAESHLAELVTGNRQQDIDQARAALDEAASEEQRATKDWTRAETLHKTDDISTAQYDQYQRNYRTAVAAAKQARERLSLMLEGTRKEEIDQARDMVDRAKAAVRLSESNQLELKRKEEQVRTSQADLNRSTAQAQLSESQLSDTTAMSPVDGTVLTKAAEVGQVLAAGTTVVTIGDTDHPWLRGYINETDLGRIKLGTKVKVTSDSFKDKVYWGHISFISSEAEYTPKQIQTQEERVKLVYRIKIEIPNPQHELKSNMPVDAEIVVE